MSKFTNNAKKIVTSKRFKYGGYSLILTALVIAVVALVNIGLTTLDKNFDLKLDMSQNKMYSLSAKTQDIVKAVDQDIYIYTLFTPGREDKAVNEILMKIKALSPRVKLENRDPDADPRFMQAFTKTGESIEAGSVIVTNKDNKLYKVLRRSGDLYQMSYNSQTLEATPTQNKTEGSVTQAINYIVSGYIPMAYIAQGHGELSMTDLSVVRSALEANNYKVELVDLSASADAVKPGDLLLFFAPTSDLKDNERDMVKTLMDKGGRIYFLFNPVTVKLDKMPNFQSLLALYDIALKQGIIFENDPAHTISQYPGLLVPDIQAHAATAPIISSGVPVILPYAGALKLPDVAPESSMTITSLLKTSDKSYLKKDVSGEGADALKQAEGDENGPFDVAVAVEKKVGGNAQDAVRFVVAYNTDFAVNTSLMNNTTNVDFFLNTAAWMRNADKDIYVRAKALSNPQLIFRSGLEQITVGMTAMLIAPVLLLAAGIFVYLKRKHL